MRLKFLVSALVLACLAGTAQAESFAQCLGRQLGALSGSAGAAAMAPITNSQPQWITVAPRGKSDCLAASHQILNKQYLRCRNGWQEYVRYDGEGRKIVLSERAIPSW